MCKAMYLLLVVLVWCAPTLGYGCRTFRQNDLDGVIKGEDFCETDIAYSLDPDWARYMLMMSLLYLMEERATELEEICHQDPDRSLRWTIYSHHFSSPSPDFFKADGFLDWSCTKL